MPRREDHDLAGVGVARRRLPGEEWGRRERGLIVSREIEIAVLADFLVAGSSMPQGLVIDGEAGIGKTTLFDATLTTAREHGFAIFSCRPAAAEAAFATQSGVAE